MTIADARCEVKLARALARHSDSFQSIEER